MSMAKIVCEHCGTIFPFERAKDFTVCPVCNASFDDGEDNETSAYGENPKTDDGHSDWITWYYYKMKKRIVLRFGMNRLIWRYGQIQN